MGTGVSDPVFTTGDVAKLVGVNFRTVIRWIDRGELDGYKLPGRGDHRVTRESLLAFIRKHGMPVPTELLDGEHRKAVLVVDDEPNMAKAIARVFKRDGWDVYTASDGFQAGALLMEHKPPLMTLDLRMPGMDGFKVLEFTRQHLNAMQLKILVISAQPKADLNNALVQGADLAIEKPFENQQLLEQANELLSLN